MWTPEKLKDRQGLATFISLMIMIMLMMVGIAAIKLADDEINIAGHELNEMSAFYAAEAGLERATASIQSQFESTGAPPSVLPSGSEVFNDCIFAYNTVDTGALTQKVLTQGTLAGLNAFVKTYTITSLGMSQVDQSQVSLTQIFECDLIPIFQFAVFYDNDLEIAPGPDMTLIGRVHTNGNLWVQSGSNLNMDSYVTSFKNFRHGRKGPGTVDDGNILIKDTKGNYKNMKNGDDSFLQSTDANWYDSASTRWGGRVQDSTFSLQELRVPLTASGDPHKILERSPGNPDSYEDRADFKIINSTAYYKIGGVWQNVTALLPAGTITDTTFYDAREATSVKSTDLDMAKLVLSGYFPPNGMIYASDHHGGSLNALRLINGSDIGGPLSVFSENPMYIKGDYNTVNKQPASLAADAITFLSNSWDDLKSTLPVDARVATATTCNASIMTGNTNTTSTNYNGGLENLPRFLEKWTGVTFTFTGSMVNLWNSQQAAAPWASDTYCKAPIRQWSYDTALDDPANHPPGTLRVRVFQRTRWQQTHVGYVRPDGSVAEI